MSLKKTVLGTSTPRDEEKAPLGGRRNFDKNEALGQGETYVTA